VNFRETKISAINVEKMQESNLFKLASVNTPHELHAFQMLQSAAPSKMHIMSKVRFCEDMLQEETCTIFNISCIRYTNTSC